jgi:hypothetical protein
MKRTWSIPEIYKEMHITVDQRTAWTIGNEVKEQWIAAKGYLPDKELRPKSNGKGTHVLAVYPEEWLERIKDVIRYHKSTPNRQGRFDL